MIKFKIKDINIYPLKVKISIETTKTLKLSEMNKRIQFYIEKNNELELLDSTIFYSHHLPESPVHSDNLLEHGEILYFNYFGSELYEGIKARIIAVNAYSATPFWISEELFLKTKETKLPFIEVENIYTDKLKSTMKINFNPEDEDKVKYNFLVNQSIYEDGISLDKIIKTETIQITGTSFEVNYDVPKYGAYRIVTKILSSNLKELYRHHSYYSKLLEPLNITYKGVVASGLEGETNFATRSGNRGYYRKNNTVYKIAKIKVKL